MNPVLRQVWQAQHRYPAGTAAVPDGEMEPYVRPVAWQRGKLGNQLEHVHILLTGHWTIIAGPERVI